MSRSRLVRSARRVMVSVAVLTATSVLGTSLASAEGLVGTASKPSQRVTVVPPIASPQTDPSPQMPVGRSGAVPAPVAAPQAGPAAPVLPPPPVVRVAPKAPASVSIDPKVATASGDGGFVEGESVEVVSKRTPKSKTFRNPDGTFTEKISNVDRHYRGSDGKWLDINDHLVADPAGGYRNGANAFKARFLPGSSGVKLETTVGTITMFPVGGSLGAPVVDAAGEAVTYSDVWPGVDVRYRVLGNTVKEEIVVRQPTTQSAYPFQVTGTTLAVEAHGSLSASGAFADKWKITAPVVFDKTGMEVSAAAPRYSVAGDVVTLNVSPVWVTGLRAADLPVVLDPSWHGVGAGNSQAYLRNPYDDGYTTCAPCQVAVGNINEPGWRTWRSTVYFPYESLFGKQVLYAKIDLYNRLAGTGAPSPLKVYGGDTVGYGGDWNWSNLGAYLGQGTAGDTFTFDAPSLRDYFQDLANRWLPGVPVKFLGDETVGAYTYKRFYAFELHIQYNDAPSQASPVPPSPGNGAQIHTLTPTLAVNASDPNGDQVYYYYRVATGADAESNVVGECPWTTSTSCPIGGGLSWNTTYYWHVYTSDGYWQTNPNWVWSFRTVNNAPAVASAVVPPSPANGAAPHSLTTTLKASATDADGDAVQYYFRFATGSDAESGSVWNSGWQSSDTWTVPAGLNWNTNYYWHVYTYDGIAQTNPNWVWSFRPSNAAPAVPAAAAPAAGTVLAQTNLSFSAGTVTDPDGDPVTYQFQVATGTDGQSGRLAVSQWLPSPAWTPPAGTFADGGSYSWLVRAQDN
ncbi:MAG: hypothetical protein ACRDV9_10815, partial [Acidimicrobiia bacterium]